MGLFFFLPSLLFIEVCVVQPLSFVLVNVCTMMRWRELAGYRRQPALGLARYRRQMIIFVFIVSIAIFAWCCLK